MRIKPGVSIAGLRPEIVLALFIAEGVYKAYGLELWLTSGTEGKHKIGSLHYVGLAADVRIRHINKHYLRPIVKEIESSLGAEFDVILKARCLHIEFQPKKGVNL